MRQLVQDYWWSGLSAGSWWLVNVTVAARSPFGPAEMLTSLSAESTVDRYPLANCAAVCRMGGLSKEL